jgi:hypothetical protein
VAISALPLSNTLVVQYNSNASPQCIHFVNFVTSFSGVPSESVVEEIVEHAALGSLLAHALAASGVGIAGALLLMETFEGGHETGTPAARASGTGIVDGLLSRHDGDGRCGCNLVDGIA